MGAFIMLILGVIDYAILKKVLYARLRDQHEQAKMTGSQGSDPAILWNIIWAMSFIVMPIAGLIFGDAVLRNILG